jgi:VanZ family protein
VPDSESEIGESKSRRSSAREADRQWYRRSAVIALAIYWMSLFTATHIPTIPKALHPGFSDKWQHYVAYAGLGLLLAAWWSLRRRLTWRSGLGLLAIVALYGAFDEVTQPLFGRDAELLDWRSDVVGAATGLALFAIAARWASRQRN